MLLVRMKAIRTLADGNSGWKLRERIEEIKIQS
jgi:hypothetical protein